MKAQFTEQDVSKLSETTEKAYALIRAAVALKDNENLEDIDYLLEAARDYIEIAAGIIREHY